MFEIKIMQNLLLALAILAAILSGTLSASDSSAAATQVTTADGPRYQ